jgi:hypothetical protein
MPDGPEITVAELRALLLKAPQHHRVSMEGCDCWPTATTRLAVFDDLVLIGNNNSHDWDRVTKDAEVIDG